MAARRLSFRLALGRCLRRERIFRDRQNPFDVYDDVELFFRFRFRRENIVFLCDIIENDIDHPLPRTGSVPPILQLMVALRFYASGCFQVVVGDIFGIDRSTISRIIERVSRAFASRLNEFVSFPTQEDAPRIMAEFYRLAGFPNVVGCLDCTHVRILAPVENEAVFVNRKGYHSINCQLVCDAKLVITNCVVNWPGSVHDARILRESNLYEVFERVPRPLPGLLLGDSGYPLKEWLMTPFTDPNTRPKERYNGAHSTTRSTIERANGVLKKRWHCLQSGLRYDPERACRIIMSCIVLHNVATTLGLPEPESDSDTDDSDSEESDDDDNQASVHAGRLARDRIVARYFQKYEIHRQIQSQHHLNLSTTKSHPACLKKIDPTGRPTMSAHPARFSPDDKYSRQRVTIKKRFGILLTQSPKPVM